MRTMPLGAYYQGHGEQVAGDMKRRYGKGWQRVFYATANARKQAPGDQRKPSAGDRHEALKRRLHKR